MRPELRSLKCHKLLSKILDLSDPLKRFAKTVTGFLLSISKNKKSFFLIYSSSSIRWSISFLYFKTFKIQFYAVPPLHYVLVCKIHICMPKMTL